MAQTQNDAKQTVHLCGREQVQLTGVMDVARFEETIAVFQTTQGDLTVEGEELRMIRLSLETGEVDLAGKFTGFFYGDTEAPTGGLFRRLFGK